MAPCICFLHGNVGLNNRHFLRILSPGNGILHSWLTKFSTDEKYRDRNFSSVLEILLLSELESYISFQCQKSSSLLVPVFNRSFCFEESSILSATKTQISKR